MPNFMKTILALIPMLMLAGLAQAVPQPGKPAPSFSLKGADGKTYNLSDYKGKYVILEWFNNKCPYIEKHYDSGNMQALQKEQTATGAVWFTILSSAPGAQGHETAEGALKVAKDRKSNATAMLLDHDGKVGKAFGAKTTPHMYIINPDGVLAYSGAIDDQPSANPKSLKNAKNFVTTALSELKAGKTVTAATTKPYGCSVKYE